MSDHSVSVTQLATGKGAYLNVLDGPGFVGVWGFAAEGIGTVHYFLRNKEGNFAVVAFDTDEWAKEWLKEHEAVWPLAIRMNRTTP